MLPEHIPACAAIQEDRLIFDPEQQTCCYADSFAQCRSKEWVGMLLQGCSYAGISAVS